MVQTTFWPEEDNHDDYESSLEGDACPHLVCESESCNCSCCDDEEWEWKDCDCEECTCQGEEEDIVGSS